MVASLADAWIKIAHNPVMNRGDIVVSYMGTWIKICYHLILSWRYSSPLRMRGAATLPKILPKWSRIFPYKKIHYTIIVYRIPRECMD